MRSSSILVDNHEQLNEKALVQRAEELAADFAREAATRDQSRGLAHKEVRSLAESGVLAARLGIEDGGPDVPFTDVVKIFMALGKADPSIAQAVLTHFGFCERLRTNGTRKQRDQYFELVRNGAVVAGAFAERGGKFVGDITTRLVRNGSGFTIQGRKYYCTGSLYANYLNILAVADDGTRVVAMCPVDRKGLTMIDDWDGMGQRTSASGTVILDNVEIGADEVLDFGVGSEKRSHFGSSAQILHAAIDTGIALAALDDAMWFAREKARPVPESGVQKATQDPYVMLAVGEMATVAHSAVAMVKDAAEVLDEAALTVFSGNPDDALLAKASIVVAEAKAVANDACLRVSEWLYRVGGASATSRSLNLDRHWRNARTHTTHDPVAYKYRAIADFYMNGHLPPISTKI